MDATKGHSMLKKMLPLLLLLAFSSSAHADKAPAAPTWKLFDAPKFGFKMEVPKKTKLTATAVGKWGGFYAKIWPAHLWGLAKLDAKHTPAEIAAFGLKVTKTKAKHWTLVTEGKDKQGFEWFQVHKIQWRNHVAIAISGVGPKGSYLLVLKTLKTNYLRFEKHYKRWHESILVY
jgi:hypothetical protein